MLIWYRVKASGKALNRSCKNLIYTWKTPPNLDEGIMQPVSVRVTIREGDELLLIKVKGQWYYLYRAVDKHGQTIDFLLTEHRDTEAALRFLKKAIRRNGLPETITIDG